MYDLSWLKIKPITCIDMWRSPFSEQCFSQQNVRNNDKNGIIESCSKDSNLIVRLWISPAVLAVYLL